MRIADWGLGASGTIMQKLFAAHLRQLRRVTPSAIRNPQSAIRPLLSPDRPLWYVFRCGGTWLTPSARLGIRFNHHRETIVGVKKTGKGRRKLGRKKRRMRARIRHRK